MQEIGVGIFAGVKKKTKEQRLSKTLNCQKFEDLCHKDQVSYYGEEIFFQIVESKG